MILLDTTFLIDLLRERKNAVDKAIELDPKFDKAWYNKGLTLFNMKDLDGALKSYDKVVKLNPKNKSAWNNRGLILMELNKPQDAMKCFDNASVSLGFICRTSSKQIIASSYLP